MDKFLLLKAILSTRKADRMSVIQREKLRKKRLQKLAAYAKANSPYYQKLYRNIGDDFCLEVLPVTDKIAMMKHFDDFITDQTISMKKIEEFTANLDHIGYMLDGKYLVFKTSGSTGNPAVVLYDNRMVSVSSAVAAVRTFAREQDYQKFMKNGRRTAGVFADYGFFLACGMSKYLQLQMPKKNNKINIDVNLPAEQIIKKLNEFQPSMLSGYPSNIALLANFEQLHIKPDVVITGGELLTDSVKQKLEKKFGCYVQTHYSCTEAGEIACECSEGHLHINEDWVIVEPVDKNNQPVGYGVRSDKVLITNLANYIQPFIRYELTDRVIVHNEKCLCGRNTCWLEIEGRTDDILEFENEIKIAPMSFYKILEEIKEIKRFQLVQHSKTLLKLRLTADDKETAFGKAKTALLDFLSANTVKKIQIELSDEIPQADKISGKFKHIVRNPKTDQRG